HYCCPEVLDWCRSNGLDYIFGVAPTTTLRVHIETLEANMKARFEAAPKDGKLRRFKEFFDGAASWSRLFLHGGAYWLMWGLRASMPKRSMWRVAQFDILRLRLIKVAARVVELKTMIKIHLPTAYPAQDVLSLALTRIPRLVT